MKYLICSDFFIDDFVGGAALNDEELFNILKDRGEDVEKVKTSSIGTQFLDDNKDNIFIISNFFGLIPEVKEEIQKLKYIIIAHDYKFVEHTNPALYKDFLVTQNEIINKEFYRNAKAIICQSSFQQEIYNKNLTEIKTLNFSGNLWSDETLEYLSSLSTVEKKEVVSVVKSPYPQKGVPESIKFCIENRFDYELVEDKDYHVFLSKLSQNAGLSFLPLTPETFSRVVMECKMMKIKVFTSDMIGASYEPWFDKMGNELIEVMKGKKEEIYQIIKKLSDNPPITSV